jgi:hypothetical protein
MDEEDAQEQNGQEEEPLYRFIVVKAEDAKQLQETLWHFGAEEWTGDYSVVQMVVNPQSREERYLVLFEHNRFRPQRSS